MSNKTSRREKNVASKTINEKYKKLEQHEHILKRPGMYIGSVKTESIFMWVFNEGTPQIVLREISYVPGLYKIYDEILVNAHDHTVRCDDCNVIKVTIDPETNCITVFNNGEGIDVVNHEEHDMLVPTLIFSELLSGTNYDDEEERIVGGMNGLGAKLTNIYSTEFNVEVVDATRDLKFRQKFQDNMYTKNKPVVVAAKGKKSYTQISFIPDFEKFGIEGLTTDILDLFKKRVYDIAMTTDAKVYYNDELIVANTFSKYIDLYFPDDSDHKKVIDISNKKWRVCAIYDPTDKIEHQNISFVNGICTSRGGTHVDHVVNQIVAKLREIILKKLKTATIKPAMIKENLIFFVDAVIVNPDFDGQTKDYLKTKAADFGSSYSVPEVFIKKIVKTGVVDRIIANVQAKETASLLRIGKGTVKYDKLYEAHKAGIRQGFKCTLILTEGDSAKAYAMAGLNVCGRDYIGVFPLKGKLLNVRDKTPAKIAANAEIEAIIKIVGLEPNKVYESTKGLRYGSIMVLTDQDVDGAHIKGLVINFIHYFWPSLIKVEGFVRSMSTPLLKITRGTGKKMQVKEFINKPSYDEWLKDNDITGWTVKYYKGLGTSSSKEAQQQFTDIEEKLIHYYRSEDNEDGENPCDIAIVKAFAFGCDKSDVRKEWLNSYNPDNYIDNTVRRVTFADFINKELLPFAVYNSSRSIPNIMDGFKPSLRKVYYGSVKKNIYKTQIKVAQLAPYIAENTEYHHGEDSLVSTIIGMARDFVGSNNINLLIPDGQFGSRLCGGNDHASARYIFTRLNPLCKKIFIEADYDVLRHQEEEGTPIEPAYYVPIIPMLLVNGTTGIGTGYSSTIEPCNPRDIYDNIKRIIAGEKIKSMRPWYRNFTGTIEKVAKNKYVARAKYEVVNDDTIKITDLPIGVWTENYKAFLNELTTTKPIDKKTTAKSPVKPKGGSKKTRTKRVVARVAKKNTIGDDIKTVAEDCTDIRVSFTITFHPGRLTTLIEEGKLEKGLNLVKQLNLTNMHLFNDNGKIEKYDSYGAILNKFAEVRLVFYQLRKDHVLGKLKKECDILKWKIKFMDHVIQGEIIIFRDGVTKKKTEVIDKLIEMEFPEFAVGTEVKPSYNYITSIGLFHLTEEEVERMKKLLREKRQEIATLKEKSPTDLWLEDLDEFIVAYDKWDQESNAEYIESLNKKPNKKPKRKAKQ